MWLRSKAVVNLELGPAQLCTNNASHIRLMYVLYYLNLLLLTTCPTNVYQLLKMLALAITAELNGYERRDPQEARAD